MGLVARAEPVCSCHVGRQPTLHLTSGPALGLADHRSRVAEVRAWWIPTTVEGNVVVTIRVMRQKTAENGMCGYCHVGLGDHVAPTDLRWTSPPYHFKSLRQALPSIGENVPHEMWVL